MSIRALFLLLFAFPLFLLGSAPVTLAQARTTSGTEALDAEGMVLVDNHEGRVKIETWDRAEVKYEAVVRPESGAEHPEATVVRVDRDEDRFVLRTEYEESNEEGGDSGGFLRRLFGGDGQNIMPVEYTLTVPRTVRVEVDDHESDVQVQGLNGPVVLDTHDGTISVVDQGGRAELATHDGPIRVQNQSGPLTVDTHEGTVELTDQEGDTEIASHDGPIRVENQSGALSIETHESDVRLRSVGGGPVTVNAHDGRIEADDLEGGLEVETHDGNGRFSLAALTGAVDVTTHDGNFTFVLPADAGFDLRTEFDDEDARLRSDFDLSPYRISSGDDDDEVNYAGSVNGGGPRFYLSAHDGSFEIRTE